MANPMDLPDDLKQLIEKRELDDRRRTEAEAEHVEQERRSGAERRQGQSTGEAP